jgi:hypothetical protein
MKVKNSNLEEKLTNLRNGYPVDHHSVGSFLLVASMPEKFNVILDTFDLEKIASKVRNRREKDFVDCVIPALSTLLKSEYGLKFTREMLYRCKKPQNEFEQLLELAQYSISGLELSSQARKTRFEIRRKSQEIEKQTLSPVELFILDEHCLEDCEREKINRPIPYISLKKKVDISLVPKFLSRLMVLYEPDEEVINSIDKYSVISNYRNGNMSWEKILELDTMDVIPQDTPKPRKNEIENFFKSMFLDYSFKYINKAFQSGQDFYAFHYTNSSDHGLFGGQFNDIIGDIFLIDLVGAKLSAKKKKYKD